MREVEVALGERSYTVAIGAGLIDQAGERLAPFARSGRIVAVTDENVWAAQGARLAASGPDVVPLIVPAGEASKSWAQLQALTERLLGLGIERGDSIIAFGGGMIGDLAGFAASILKRGCPYVQIPTSLVAQVDSSVGGKTAINSAAGKNLIGAFHQPAAVLIDPSTLGTLPDRELRAGYAEVVKYGLIGDGAFFDWCETNGGALLARDEAALLHAIETCVSAKAAIVADDERETTGRRALLNFGHTFAHAFESESDFAILHGEAVAIGMILAFRFSAERGLCPGDEAERVAKHLESAGLATVGRLDPGRLVQRMASDKKAVGGRVPFVLTKGIGKAFVDRSVELNEVEDFLRRELQR
ncbi:MAG: 3-dehydroquinate synthase [Sphingomonadales bacterium]|jgi:3-dehydroquinate synthase|nr:3-dehydroquinate synthase [Sphingomonadales bacterium]